MTDSFQIALSTNPLLTSPLANVVVKSVKLHRLRLIDALNLHNLGQEINRGWNALIPEDIDDVDFTNDTIQGYVDRGKTPQEILDIMRIGQTNDITTKQDGGANPLKWQRCVDAGYQAALRQYYLSLKQELITANKNTIASMHSGKAVNDWLQTTDVTQFCKITDITMDMEFNNQATIEISIPKFKEFTGNSASFPLPRENDVLEITMTLPNEIEMRAFMGFVSGISFGKEYGNLTTINVVAHGLSKMMVVNRMVTDRAIISQFEAGELAQVGITVWSHYFSNQTVDQIFQFIMTNELGMYADKNSVLGASAFARYSVEKVNLDALLVRETTQIESMSKRLQSQPSGQEQINAAEKYIAEPGDSRNTPIQLISLWATWHEIGFIDNVEAELLRIQGTYLDAIPSEADLGYARLLLFITEIRARIDNVATFMRSISDSKGTQQDGKSYQFSMKFHDLAFTDIGLFQLIYLPLMTMALLRIRDDEVVAKFKGKRAVGFDLLLRKSFQLFFSQLSSPANLMDALKKTAKFKIYENESNQIVAELPRYNEFIADLGERIEDFIISNPSAKTEIVRQDLGIVTRFDAKQFVPMVAYLDIPNIQSRQYTDVAVLSKYGMRAEAPVQNPNCVTAEAAQMFAALEVTANNANTRTLSLSHPVDRQFKLGRLYFLAINDLEQQMGGPVGHEDTDGYVGYLTSAKIVADYGNPLIYNLSFNYVRRAKLIIGADGTMVANFKILPDLGGLIDIVEAARKAGTLDPALNTNKEPPVSNEAQVISGIYVADNAWEVTT